LEITGIGPQKLWKNKICLFLGLSNLPYDIFACELSNLIVSFEPSSDEIQYLEKKYSRVWGSRGRGWDVVLNEKLSVHIYDNNGNLHYNVWSLKELVRNMLQHYDESEKLEVLFLLLFNLF
jgi:hypothetical protein